MKVVNTMYPRVNARLALILTILCACGEDGAVAKVSPTDGGAAKEDAATGTPLPCDVKAVLETHCWECHGQTLKYGAPSSLARIESFSAEATTAPGLQVHEAMIARVHSDDTTVRMPPPPRDALTSAELDTLHAWTTAGMPADNGSCVGSNVDAGKDDAGHEGEHPTETLDGGELPPPVDPGECDETVRFLAHNVNKADDTTPYKVPLQSDQYTCFTFKAPFDGPRHALQFTPIIDDARVVHHWILYAEAASSANDGSIESCSGSHPSASFVAGWAPGGMQQTMPAGVGALLETGASARYILEIHYNNSANHADAADRSGVEICATKKLREISAATHWLGTEKIALLGGTQDEDAICDPSGTEPVTLLSLWPHMHRLGRHMKLEILRADGSISILHDKDFSFEYQGRSALSAVVMPGDRLRTTCSYDNKTGKVVSFGPRTSDEMCYGFVLAYPAGGLAGPTSKATVSINACVN